MLDSFAAVLGTAQASVSNVIKLSDSTAPQLAEGVTPLQYRELAQQPEVMQAMETCITVWCDEINLVSIGLCVFPSNGLSCVLTQT